MIILIHRTSLCQASLLTLKLLLSNSQAFITLRLIYMSLFSVTVLMSIVTQSLPSNCSKAKTSLIPLSENAIILFQSNIICNKIIYCGLYWHEHIKHQMQRGIKIHLEKVLSSYNFNFLPGESLRFIIGAFTSIYLKHCYRVWPTHVENYWEE